MSDAPFDPYEELANGTLSRGPREGGQQHKRQRRILAREFTHCANPACGIELDWQTPGLPHSGVKDHVVPKAAGGSLATA
ncbi:MAG TPA: hypothetical protein VEF72_14030 [Mycobacterium sp.]|nr:hypothetical protein [Mycobacterium sp.]